MSDGTSTSDLDGCLETPDGIDCAAVFEQLDLILDRELPASELAALQGHLAACLPCTDRADFETQLRAVVRDRCADQAPAELKARIRSLLQLR